MLKVGDWVKVKKKSNSWFISDHLNNAERTMVISTNEKYHMIQVAHLLNMWLPEIDFETAGSLDNPLEKKFKGIALI